MNLAEVSRITRKAVAGLATLIVIYLIGFWLRQPLGDLWVAVFPPEDLPTVSFGVLPQLNFIETQTMGSSPTFTLNTRDGSLPTNLPRKLPVFKYDPPAFSYGAGAKAQKDAQILGFTDEMRISDLSSDIFQWQDIAFGGSLAINTSTSELDLYTPLGGKGTLYPSNKLSRFLAIDTAKELLTDLGRWTDEFYTSDVHGYQEVTLGKFGPSGVLEANTTLDAQFAKVDFYREFENYKILGPKADQSLVSITLREPGSADVYPQLSFPRARIRIWSFDSDPSATYPLIPVSVAWQQVLEGNGIISSVTPNDKNPFEVGSPVAVQEILINEIYPAYYDNSTPQEYLQPIYVFEGNYRDDRGGTGNIFIYYPAVSGEYVLSDTPVEGQPQ